jgi:hypothetical protein
LKINRRSEEYIVSILRNEEAEQNTSVKAGGKPAYHLLLSRW